MQGSERFSELGQAERGKFLLVNRLLTMTTFSLERLEELSKRPLWTHSDESELFIHLEYLETVLGVTEHNLKYLASVLSAREHLEAASRSMPKYEPPTLAGSTTGWKEAFHTLLFDPPFRSSSGSHPSPTSS